MGLSSYSRVPGFRFLSRSKYFFFFFLPLRMSPRAHIHVVGMLRFMFLTLTAELVHCFLFRSCVYFCLYGPFNCISFHKFFRQLSTFSLCPSGLLSFFSFFLSFCQAHLCGGSGNMHSSIRMCTLTHSFTLLYTILFLNIFFYLS